MCCLFYCGDDYGWSANKLVLEHPDVPENELLVPSMMGGEAAVSRHGGGTAQLTLPFQGGGAKPQISRFLSRGRLTLSPLVEFDSPKSASFQHKF